MALCTKAAQIKLSKGLFMRSMDLVLVAAFIDFFVNSKDHFVIFTRGININNRHLLPTNRFQGFRGRRTPGSWSPSLSLSLMGFSLIFLVWDPRSQQLAWGHALYTI